MSQLNNTLFEVTRRISRRSHQTRLDYVARCQAWEAKGPNRSRLGCTNLAHGLAAAPDGDKRLLARNSSANIAIVSAYNDMLSAHQPLQSYPELIKAAVRAAGGTAQFAGGVPAMCDGVTQGAAGMELSLFSRDVIAQATAIALAHDMFDGVLCLGVCDKIVPGMLMGALSFGHLPVIFVPAGPMPSGLPNRDKARVRELFADGKVDKSDLLKAECAAYHSPGTCTFYGTANSNQMLMEIMGLHLPGTAFVQPGTALREALTRAAGRRITELSADGPEPSPLYRILDEKALVNGIVGLLATGGSTNHTIHLIAIARMAGIQINWDDFAELSAVVPQLTRVYPNGSADVNQFHTAGGIALVISELLDTGLLHPDTTTVAGQGLAHYTRTPALDSSGQLNWSAGARESGDPEIIASCAKPFSPQGGLVLLQGNLGRAMIKTSAVAEQHRVVRAPARVFHSQAELQEAFNNGELTEDMVAVVTHQGPKANGMPELHKLTPPLGILQNRGLNVALVTDGRMSGASGKVPAAIHITPECLDGGPLAKVRNGDIIHLDCNQGLLMAKVDEPVWLERGAASVDLGANQAGCGRELFASMRRNSTSAEEGACSLLEPLPRVTALDALEVDGG